MKKIIVLSIFAANIGFAASISLDNKIANSKDSLIKKIAIQWATSIKNIEDSNNKMRRGIKLNTEKLYLLSQRGEIHLNIPQKAEYFRVLVWSNNKGQPDFLTNWVDIIPNKKYTLNKNYLIPIALLASTGC